MARTKRAFTLAEVLVCIAIISVLAGLLTPALLSAKKKGHEIVCVSNLRQIWMALSQYRQDNMGVDFPAESSQMGFPLSAHVAVDGPDAGNKPMSDVFRCKGRMLYDESNYGAYAQMWPVPYGALYDSDRQLEWKEFVGRLEDSTPIFADWSHQLSDLSTPWSVRRAMAMTLGGTFTRRTNRGEPSKYVWW